VAQLQAALDWLASEEPQPIPFAPRMAEQIDGQLYGDFDDPTGPSGIGLSFNTRGDEASLVFVDAEGGSRWTTVGLDGVPRMLEEQPLWAFTGAWEDDTTFVIQQHYVGQPMMMEYTLVFSNDGETMTLTVTEYASQSTILGPMTGTRLR
jgi:hypothetical protein